MSYQYDPNTCAPASASGNNDPQFQNIGAEVENALMFIPRTMGWFFSIFVSFLPVLLAILLVYFVVDKFTPGNVVVTILLAILLYIFYNNMTGSNLAGSLPKATYPIPPHLGLDGVSLANQSCINCNL